MEFSCDSRIGVPLVYVCFETDKVGSGKDGNTREMKDYLIYC